MTYRGGIDVHNSVMGSAVDTSGYLPRRVFNRESGLLPAKEAYISTRIHSVLNIIGGRLLRRTLTVCALSFSAGPLS